MAFSFLEGHFVEAVLQNCGILSQKSYASGNQRQNGNIYSTSGADKPQLPAQISEGILLLLGKKRNFILILSEIISPIVEKE